MKLLLLALLVVPAHAVDLHVQFGALERILSQQMFTGDGRHYVRGNATNRCNFAYLENPHINGADGKLRIRARFTGRSSINLFGQCVAGVGGALDLTIAAVPQFTNGNIIMRDVVVTAENADGFFARRVCSAMATTLERDFKYPLGELARRAMEDPAALPGYPRELHEFRITDMRVSKDALDVALDFELTIK
jgi:hypothetical protein